MMKSNSIILTIPNCHMKNFMSTLSVILKTK